MFFFILILDEAVSDDILKEAGRDGDAANWAIFTSLLDLMLGTIHSDANNTDELIEFFAAHIFWSGRDGNDKSDYADVKAFVRTLYLQSPRNEYVFG